MAARISRLISSCSSVVTNRAFTTTSFTQRVYAFPLSSEVDPLCKKSLIWHRSGIIGVKMASTDSSNVAPKPEPFTTPESCPAAEPAPTSTAAEGSTNLNEVQSSEITLENSATSPSGKPDPASSQANDSSASAAPSTNNSNSESEVKKPRVKKIKAAILLSYSGQGYYGMQMQNSGARTIENDLLKGFLDAGAIDEEGFQKPKQMKFQRAARTDKNVSAARNIISMIIPNTFNPEAINQQLPDQIRVMDFRKVTKGFDAKNMCNARTYLYMIPTFAFAPIEEEVQESYRITPEVLENLRKVLQLYLGSKNFHNFTSRKKPTDPSATRYIMSFDSSEPFMKDGLEYVVLKVKGQSFMMHQIRKMIGLAVGILRGFATEETLKKAFTLDRIDIPMAPGLGLMLGEVHYDYYNKKYGNDGMHEPIIWDNVADKVEQFCQEKIYCTVSKTEVEEKSMLNWVGTVPFHTYDSRDASKGFGPLGQAMLRAARERGESIDDELDEEGEDESDDEVPSKKQRTN